MFTEQIVEESSDKPPSSIISNVHPIVQEDWSKVTMAIPEHIRITRSEKDLNQLGISCVKTFKKGEVVYEADFFIVEANDLPEKIEFETDQGNFKIVKNVNTCNLGNSQMIVWTFDGYMNHECEPNTYSEWNFNKDNIVGRHSFRCIALKDIAIGDELTCDYNLFWYKDGDEEFYCRCGSQNCYRMVHGFYYLNDYQKQVIMPLISEFFYPFFGIEKEIVAVRKNSTPLSAIN